MESFAINSSKTLEEDMLAAVDESVAAGMVGRGRKWDLEKDCGR
jgi:hypothetical protein